MEMEMEMQWLARLTQPKLRIRRALLPLFGLDSSGQVGERRAPIEIERRVLVCRRARRPKGRLLSSGKRGSQKSSGGESVERRRTSWNKRSRREAEEQQKSSRGAKRLRDELRVAATLATCCVNDICPPALLCSFWLFWAAAKGRLRCSFR